ncbi:tRNA (5-methylaminomethyl-2-thiouridine)(34)-methyltransferase MnmD [Nafulsella turpanensis]|uniref:tRNA (5-methylaminomethyl-2-thiouridine)(34)-methyltransferase MnmD n=1 Tax=Nafulsella turpanensis TaxID=1265690 RepID=UPI00034A7BDC|nr:tRNA (5-methylaminomethyl-2-thiouridine)(34)-methyltransferase MnmD [Nafulsella turpanensis]
MREVKVIETEDGSSSLFLPELNETYHSFHGALGESRHVFIKMGLAHWREQFLDVRELHVLEVGFGTGLNALLSLEAAEQEKLTINFTSLEPYPIAAETVQALNYGSMVAEGRYENDFLRMHTCPWGEAVKISPYFTLRKERYKLEDFSATATYDLIFFDAFAPSKQAELWEKEQLEKISRLMAPGAIFTTYCAKGQLKRDLKALGLEVETLPGAPGKKEMVRAGKSGEA